jgi:hypothetical protein
MLGTVLLSLAIWEVEIRRIPIRGQLRQKLEPTSAILAMMQFSMLLSAEAKCSVKQSGNPAIAVQIVPYAVRQNQFIKISFSLAKAPLHTLEQCVCRSFTTGFTFLSESHNFYHS